MKAKVPQAFKSQNAALGSLMLCPLLCTLPFLKDLILEI